MDEIQEIFEAQKEMYRQEKERKENSKKLATTTKPRVKWEIERSLDKDYIIRLAYELGWLENKVQVKKYDVGIRTYYAIEPFEEDCHCPGLVKPPHNDGE